MIDLNANVSLAASSQSQPPEERNRWSSALSGRTTATTATATKRRPLTIAAMVLGGTPSLKKERATEDDENVQSIADRLNRDSSIYITENDFKQASFI